MQTDLKDRIPDGHFDQPFATFDSKIPNSNFLNREMQWGYFAGTLGKSLHFEGPVDMTPRQIAASDVLMNLGMLAASEASRSATWHLNKKATELGVDDGNAGSVARQLDDAIDTFHGNIRGALAQYLNYLNPAEQKPFLPLLTPEPPRSIEARSQSIETLSPGNVSSSNQRVDITTHQFSVALSFAGESRSIVHPIATHLVSDLGVGSVFYDNFYIPQLARPNLDNLLQDIYRRRTKLIVVFLSADYQRKEWCGIELRSIRELLLERTDERIMFIRLDDGEVDGVFKTDGYVDARRFKPNEIAAFIVERLSYL